MRRVLLSTWRPQAFASHLQACTCRTQACAWPLAIVARAASTSVRSRCSLPLSALDRPLLSPSASRLRTGRIPVNPHYKTRRTFHDYFVTHLPSSSLHPDSRTAGPSRHQLPRSASSPHTPPSDGRQQPSPAPIPGVSRDTTVVRIPLRSAKHHFGVSLSRGQRPYNEDAFQAGIIEIPAFAKRMPISVTRRAPASSPLQAYRERQDRERAGQIDAAGEGTAANGSSGDPQIFYFGVFDGHGGPECSDFLRESLHTYIERAARDFELGSTLKGRSMPVSSSVASQSAPSSVLSNGRSEPSRFPNIDRRKIHESATASSDRSFAMGRLGSQLALQDGSGLAQWVNAERVLVLRDSLLHGWKDLVGGYFRRFRPNVFVDKSFSDAATLLTYSFLRADLDFIQAQVRKSDTDVDAVAADAPLNAADVLHSPATPIGGPRRFKGGSTASVAMISTPTPVPFWNPSTPSSLLVAHVGDSRVLLCRTADGLAVPLTADHHPSHPTEGARLRRYAANIATDSFGEERLSGLANTRAFGDMGSKRIGVSAEPDVRRLELGPAEYSFLVLLSDGVSSALDDQEVLDIIKEARTPEQGARDVVAFATEVSQDGDNATCVCVRLGGWERRSEGGVGSLGTREQRDLRRQEAQTPRSRRQ